MKKPTKILCVSAATFALAFATLPLAACAEKADETVTLRVSNWEEYIDLGDWGDDELIDIANPYDEEAGGIIGINSMVEDFTVWFKEKYGFDVNVEYSTFGTNEDLYNRLNLGDTYDLICPSDYLIMQLLREGKLEPYSDSFADPKNELNYYTNNVSGYISDIFSENDWDEYAACYMWGTTGFVYNPELLKDEADVSTWQILTDTAYNRQVTVKDNVRDAYFAALGAYAERQEAAGNKVDLNALMNEPTDEIISAAEDILKAVKNNVYSFETDSGKSDMITGKVISNFQWSGDGVYIMDEADADENNPTELWYSVPDICTNLWFDGWVMLKDGINGDANKKLAAEAFVNFLSRPDNAVRNMYYIGYTSSIASDTTLEYLEWNYGAEEDCEEIYEYDLSYFFGEGTLVPTDKSNFVVNDDGTIDRGRQLFAQYPPSGVIGRSVIMRDFKKADLEKINQMWINVRCLDVKDFDPAAVWTVVGIIIAGSAAIVLYKFRDKIFVKRKRSTSDNTGRLAQAA